MCFLKFGIKCFTDTDTVSRIQRHDLHCLDYWADSVPNGCNSLSVSARHGSSVPNWTVYACHCISKSSWRSSVRHNQQLGRTTLQTVNIRHPCVQCRWSSLLECLTRPFEVIGSFGYCFRHQLKHFLFCRYWHYYFSASKTSSSMRYILDWTGLDWTDCAVYRFWPCIPRRTF